MFFRKYFCKLIHGDLVDQDETIELTMSEFLLGNENFVGLKKVIEIFFEINKDQIN